MNGEKDSGEMGWELRARKKGKGTNGDSESRQSARQVWLVVEKKKDRARERENDRREGARSRERLTMRDVETEEKRART